jgi:hypothetical protein
MKSCFDTGIQRAPHFAVPPVGYTQVIAMAAEQ